MKTVILNIVEENPGIKTIDLIYKVASVQTYEDSWCIIEGIFELVQSGELNSVEYTLPGQAYINKSIYFPKGTKLSTITK
jgi:hypothetical protein